MPPDHRRVPGDRLHRRTRSLLTATAGLIVFGLVGLYILVVAISDLPETIAAARGEGVPGTFTAARRDCADNFRAPDTCVWRGRFVSRDQAVILEDAFLAANDPPGQVGDRVTTLYEGQTTGQVYLVDGSTDWLWGVLLLILGVGSVVGTGFAVYEFFILDLVRERRRRGNATY
ncbi:DUF3592 domain-containing protein [Georgenia thermotolerans]|uniref:DUF3592 domain-containing protein n=1 Tax=Georgenia thermotolerans TaxID=527326 RepID=A0A7J5UR55_9MICO|nr:DUF3592 domain-containing protein [Georgenia thermotolerans]KAE8764604.1 hypothetical protein GB883_08005 [Georgenia thermotolerans]